MGNQKALPLGFTFSFPLRQVGLTKGYLINWTKGYQCSGVVGKDIVSLLKEAISKRKVNNNQIVFDLLYYCFIFNFLKVQ